VTASFVLSLLTMSAATLPVVDLDVFLRAPTSAAAQAECTKAADALVAYGAVILHDPRVVEADNERFLDLLEDYFAQPEAVLRADERPELGYQVGVTLENTGVCWIPMSACRRVGLTSNIIKEKPKCAADEPCLRIIERLAPEERPLDISGHHPDPKCRFFWRMGERPPYKTEFPGLNAANVLPADPAIRERWEPTMQRWGSSMKTA
jgi:hypothetical protein